MMNTTNQTGLNANLTKDLADKLNTLLANYQVFYTNTRGLHWNIAGEKFFELHAKFEELYTDALVKIDEIAERILTIGGTPKHRFTDYIEMSTIPESDKISEGREAVQLVIDSYKTLLGIEREIYQASDEAGDEGTNSLMSDYIREQEKTLWMYAAYLR
jgi:starvation-inducible DNA-binding protein